MAATGQMQFVSVGLPKELQIEILHHLHLTSVYHAALVSEYWADLVRQDSLWRLLFHRLLGEAVERVMMTATNK